MKIYKWGIIGLGHIAAKFAEGLTVLPNATLYGVASRDEGKAKAFAENFNVPNFYSSYDTLLSNPEIDVIYIATPHSLHCELILLCIKHKKAVLCEKPVTINGKELLQVRMAAQTAKTFLMEAMWTRFVPSMHKALALVEEGAIGAVRIVKADFGFRGSKDPKGRHLNPELAGGALLDVGIYPLFLSLLFLGKVLEVKAMADIGATGVDESMGLLIRFEQRRMAVLTASFVADTGLEAEICGEKGTLKIHRHWWRQSALTLRKEDGSEEHFSFPKIGNGYNFEAAEVMRCLDKGLCESPLHALDFSQRMMQLMDQIRKECGIVYPGDI